MKKKIENDKIIPIKKTPLGVSIISAVFIIFSLYLIVSSIVSMAVLSKSGVRGLFGGESSSKFQEFRLALENGGMEYNESNLAGLINLGMIITIIFSVFLFISGLYLLFRKNWARISLITLSYIFAFLNFAGLFANPTIISVIYLVIEVAIGTYLLRNKEVKLIFRKQI
jgi:hypothetical protein